jgi:hypothetical protein
MATEGDQFVIKKPMDEEGFSVLVERDKGRFLSARNGDHFMCPFQCDLCHFRNIQKRDPTPDTNRKDALMLRCIRRANLDALWARESSTVVANGREMRKIALKADMVNMAVPTPELGPFPVNDDQGMAMAVCILMRSLDPGINEEYVQYGTARKMRSAYSNFWQASVEGGKHAVVQRNTTKMFMTSCPTNGFWFERFMLGMHKRQGDQSYPDLAISIDVMLALMERFERAWEVAKGQEKEERAVLFPALFSIITYCGGFRGEETPLMELSGTRKNYSESGRHKLSHVVVSLVGRFKNEIGEHRHMLPLAAVTASGLKPRMWVGRMLEWYRKQGISSGPVFRNFEKGTAARANTYEYDILLELDTIQKEGRDIISETVDVFERYGVSRSFRRGSNTHAINQGVSKSDIDHNNRWSVVERANGMAPKLGMQQHYADVLQMLPTLLRYSSAL